jgi:hypothetical protein
MFAALFTRATLVRYRVLLLLLLLLCWLCSRCSIACVAQVSSWTGASHGALRPPTCCGVARRLTKLQLHYCAPATRHRRVCRDGGGVGGGGRGWALKPAGEACEWSTLRYRLADGATVYESSSLTVSDLMSSVLLRYEVV